MRLVLSCVTGRQVSFQAQITMTPCYADVKTGQTIFASIRGTAERLFSA